MNNENECTYSNLHDVTEANSLPFLNKAWVDFAGKPLKSWDESLIISPLFLITAGAVYTRLSIFAYSFLQRGETWWAHRRKKVISMVASEYYSYKAFSMAYQQWIISRKFSYRCEISSKSENSNVFNIHVFRMFTSL